MFGRLLKHELLTNIKRIAIICGIIIGSSLMMGISYKLGWSILFSISCLALFISFFAVSVLTFIYVFQSIGRNTFDKRGYITFQIPVTSHDIVWSKILSILIFYVCIAISMILALIIILILFNINLSVVSELLDVLIQLLTIPGFIMAIFYALLSTLSSILMLFFAFTLCNTGIVKGHKVIMPILLYAGLSFCVGTIEIISPINLYFYSGINGACGITNDIAAIYESTGVLPISFSLWTLITYIISIVGFYFGTTRLMDKKLELQ